MSRLYLHIGMSKAGSTAIQYALLEKASELEAHGILNSMIGRHRGAHWGLLKEIRDATATHAFDLLRCESKDYDTTVVSCEAFWFLKEDGLDRLRTATAAWDTHVVLYLRRPGDFLRSTYRQQIKACKQTARIDGFLGKDMWKLEYDALLERWSAAFPVTVRIYDAVRLRLEQDFLELIGAPNSTVDRRIANPTPSDGAIRVMLAVNRVLSKESRRRKINKHLRRMERAFSWLPAIDDAPFHECARAAVERWDRSVLLRHLSEEDLRLLSS